MTQTIDNLRELGDVINRGEPAEVIYDLGKGEDRTGLIVTLRERAEDGFREGFNVSNRVNDSPLIKWYESAGETAMDITDPTDNEFEYRGLRPKRAEFQELDNPPYEKGDLEVERSHLQSLLVG